MNASTDINSSTFWIGLTIIVLTIYLLLSSTVISLIEIVIFITFMTLIVLFILKYFFNIDIKASLNNVFSKEPELDIVINKLEDSLNDDSFNDEVYHISDNIYTYEDAKGICGNFGGRLANYFDIENAYKEGGEWCSYGWSDDQMVFYPTQKNTYDSLKKYSQTKNDCGRPGVNGGFIGNPNARFGVNCFGKKPTITPEEQELMDDKPFLTSEMQDNDKVRNIDISPFNSDKWNM